MPRGLAAQKTASPRHLFGDKTIADVRPETRDMLPFQRTDEPHPAHRRKDDARRLALPFEGARRKIEDAVAVHHVPLPVRRDTAVGVAVERKAEIEPLPSDERTQRLGMSGAAPLVDVAAVGRNADRAHFRPERIEHGARKRRGAAVGAVQPHAEAAERAARKGEEIAHIAAAARNIVDRSSDLPAHGKRELPLSVEVRFHPQQEVIRAFFAALRKQLDTVVFERVVTRRDHDAEAEAFRPHEIGDGRRRRHMQKIGVGARRDDARSERVFEHVGRAARIFADEHPPLPARCGAAQKPADAEGVLRRQLLICTPAESVRAEILHPASSNMTFHRHPMQERAPRVQKQKPLRFGREGAFYFV